MSQNVTPDSVSRRNAARTVGQESVLRWRGETYHAERRYYRDGIRRPPTIVFVSDGTAAAIHFDGQDFLAVLKDGTDFLLTPDGGFDDQGQLALSKR